MAMKFWGIEVNSKGPCKVTLEEDYVVHLSQATLGEMKKDGEPVMVHVKVGDQKLVLGVLSKTTPQLSIDLVFEKEFEISHNWKNGTVHLMGYKSEMGQPEDDDMFLDSSDEEGMDLPVLHREKNGTAAAPAAAPKAAAKQGKGNKSLPDVKDDSDEDDSEDEDDDDDEDDSDEDMQSLGDDSDADLDDEDSEEETPAKKPESGKKRTNVDAKTPESKKAKLVTPQKTDGKKGAHTATPHPSKKGGKTPGDKATPKSAGQVSCEPCKKTFNSDFALESHNKAKHSAK
ncbi:hypothetical protein BVRB_9g211080 [Beta vulgaris subsp. vulgaris]|uniref:histone deacetylase HDT1 n=1 Tax=Beta vulgaris subsp. vulgaris TaxID=3555 RepID=UPI00053F9672|nr:histone deacetylase HDT1 [Beta vulgaris subsp. vulgaris]KMT01647.1 hypothetical protein BVRB_9g211080 [Beta vulgaris subsp. vulgaris]